VGKRIHTTTCVDCHDRPARYSPGLCARCWRRKRYNDPTDDYRERVIAYKVAYVARKRVERETGE
jgi:hypothetical protein